MSPTGSPPGFILGIGASAGGLSAARRFLDALPSSPQPPISPVLVMHLDPRRESQLGELLGRKSSIPVHTVREATRIEPNHMYVLAPGFQLELSEDGETLLPSPRDPSRSGFRTTIDTFLQSLAQVKGEQSVAVILSGTGSDGARGAREIQAVGGVVFAQDPSDAERPEMPRNVIATGAVDRVLPITRLVPELLEQLGRPRPEEPAAKGEDLGPILDFLLEASGHDFRLYKRTTVLRRMARRMRLRRAPTLEAYLEDLKADVAEVDALFRDLLIGVTGFFREPEAWEQLRTRIVPDLLEQLPDGETLRVWTPACSTGEEAYSLAMMLVDAIEGSEKLCHLQVFATDIHPDVLQRAREGRYSEGIVDDVPAEYLKRFFEHKDLAYQVLAPLRDVLLFSEHSILGDPPFSRLDLVTCRNLLIYLEASVQERVLELFHYSLRPGGLLLLGRSESASATTHLFEPVAKGFSLYRRLDAAQRTFVEFPIAPTKRTWRPASRTASASRAPQEIADLVRSALLAEYGPTAVLIDRKQDVLYHHGSTEAYLRQPPGETTRSLTDLAREGLAGRLSSGLHRVLREGERVHLRGVEIEAEGGVQRIEVALIPLQKHPGGEGMTLVCFRDDVEGHDILEAEQECDGADPRVRALEEELRASRWQLRETVEELETANRDLKIANQEVMSINEELQSSNEELETSKEELQSLNEELSTLNTELAEKVGHLEGANDDLRNLINGTGVAAIFLDSELRIFFFTPTMTQLFNLISTDVGRPLGDLTPRFDGPDLATDAEQVLDTLETLVRVVRSDEGRWFRRRVLPYRTSDHRIAGVVVTFEDIDEVKRFRRGQDEDMLQLARLVEICPTPMIWLDGDGRIRALNAAARVVLDVASEEVRDQTLERLLPIGEAWATMLEGIRSARRGEAESAVLESPAGMVRVATLGSEQGALSGVFLVWEAGG